MTMTPINERCDAQGLGDFQRIAVIGGGLMGSSVLRALRARSDQPAMLSVHDICARTRDRLGQFGLADRYCATAASAVAGADLVILAIPVGAFGPVLQAIRAELQPGATITDVGSVKTTVSDTFGHMLPAHVHAIPGHPIAGKEASGPEAGCGQLFHGRWVILTPEQNVDDRALTRLSDFWISLGARVASMSAQKHDSILAMTSHLPHLLAFSMMKTVRDAEGRQGDCTRFSAGGFRDFTRIAGSDALMWRDIFMDNRDNVLAALSQFLVQLSALKSHIEEADSGPLLEMLEHIRESHRQTFTAAVRQPGLVAEPVMTNVPLCPNAQADWSRILSNADDRVA
ncbi:prephenate dehydrogenase/arogenate dehydrogenase family protein [Thalassococcus sp. S3]|uniref:prephenate dehydrogenase n=1 Tax=Thalassococcus sp. S3 TaxID=2017482 RepID=UPI0010243DA0|nr:prephenate dehydrogenase/arogenate dehydrogenase family protein [Thalassococcus sp. S3]QBF32037.1 hypothetical protein CFI11_12505 [Thalassococcus sp. S3]